MTRIVLILISVLTVVISRVNAQTQGALIRKGNQLYRQGEFDKSLLEYEQAVKIAPPNALANFNFGNAF